MSKFNSIFVLAASLSLGNLAFADAPVLTVSQVDLPPAKVEFQPSYKDGDNVELALKEFLPTSCFRSGPAEIQITGNDILIRNKAFRIDGKMCLMTDLPHEKEIELGSLPPGDYRIFTDDGHTTNLAAQFSVSL